MSIKNQVWERQKGETAVSFAKFKIYLKADHTQPLKEFCESQNWKYGTTKKLFYKYDWANRVMQYDNYMVAAETEAIKKKRAEDAVERDIRHVKMAKLQQEIGEKALAQVGHNVTVREAIKLIENGVKIEREVAGEPSEIHKHEIDVPNEIKIRIVTREDIENERKSVSP